jgi:hypothetical protein
MSDIIKSIQENSVTIKNSENILKCFEKGGEGSKGGKIIGHTKSGKPIYDRFNHPAHKDFTKEDHRDAGKVHDELHQKHSDLSEEKFSKRDKYNKNIDAGEMDEVIANHHYTQASKHDEAADFIDEQEKKNKDFHDKLHSGKVFDKE